MPLFTELQNQFQIKPGLPVADDQAPSVQPNLKIKRYLTPSYRNAFHFTAPRVPEDFSSVVAAWSS